MFDKTRVLTIAKDFMDGKTDAHAFHERITRCLAEEMACNRASLWAYNDALMRDAITCLGLYDVTDASFAHGTVLRDEDFGAYFDAMRRDGMIVASDARHHPSTDCFNEVYFDPLGIVSLLDVGIDIGGEPWGLFCCENTTTLLEWTPRHIDFLRATGTLIGLALKKAALSPARAA